MQPDEKMTTVRKIPPIRPSCSLEFLNKNSVLIPHIFIVIVRHQESRYDEDWLNIILY